MSSQIDEVDLLSTSLQRFELSVSAANVGIWDWFTDSDTVYYSPIWKAQIGYKDNELENNFATWQEHLHPDDSDNVQQAVAKFIEHPIGKYINEFRFRHKDGSYIWILAKAEAELDGNGKVSRMFGSHAVITKRKEAEEKIKTLNTNLELMIQDRTKELEITVQKLNREIKQRILVEEKMSDSIREKEVLLREITHRIKNNLQIISSLINLQKNNLSSPAAIESLNQTASRIRSMGMIHEVLYKSNNFDNLNFKDYIQSLLTYIKSTFDVSNIELSADIDNLILSLDTATNCGIIIMELITNSVKSAFPDNQKGSIQIKMRSIDDATYKICISDDGIGFPDDVDFKNTSTLGMQIVTSLTDQLGGEISILKGSGTTFELIIPK